MKVYFRNLDGLRFIAAFLVILQHCSDYKNFAVPTYSNIFQPYVAEAGRYGVTLFFVLSGFLITYLLLSEQKKTQTIDIKKFYIRRILRIWPLYFAFGILIISTIDIVLRNFGIHDHTPKVTNLLYLATFTINFQLLFGAYNRGIIEVLWSVCVEEQFYAVWPWAVKWGRKRIKTVIAVFIATGLVSSVVMHLLAEHGYIHGHMNPVYIFPLCKFGHFGIGATGAYLLFHKDEYPRFFAFVRNKLAQAVVILLALLVVFQIIRLPKFFNDYFLDMVPALLFGYIVVAAVSENFIFNFEYALLRKMGIYTYGIYMLHPSIAQVIVFFFKKYVKNGFFAYEILFPLVVTVVAVVVAGISYEVFEKRFLNMKKKYTIVQSHTS